MVADYELIEDAPSVDEYLRLRAESGLQVAAAIRTTRDACPLRRMSTVPVAEATARRT